MVRAFVPDPPEGQFMLGGSDLGLLARASAALGRLDGHAGDLIDASLFTYLYVRQEAVLSSQIEGTQSTLNDLLSHEHGLDTGVPLNDVAEVSRYVQALEYGLGQLRAPDGLPISLRLLRELHRRLLASGRGSQQNPGEFRTSQNWIGGSRPGNASYVPPPPNVLPELLGQFEVFLHDPDVPALVRAGIAHAYFETLHPFLDGNGRVGRLLIPLLLIHDGELGEPHLYVSLYFKQHRAEYYERLQAMRAAGDWSGWLRFFFEAIRATATQAITASREAKALYEADRERASTLSGTGSVLRVLAFLTQRPMTTSSAIVKAVGISPPTANTALRALEHAGIVEEVSGKKRGRVYAYRGYIDALAKATLE